MIQTKASLEKVEDSPAQSTREKFRQRLRDGKLEDSIIEIEVDESRYPGVGVIPGMGNEDMMIQIQDVFGNIFPKKTRKKKSVSKKHVEPWSRKKPKRLLTWMRLSTKP
jgi:ATP-dependent HslUV protease ATP-binding subunit HslU